MTQPPRSTGGQTSGYGFRASPRQAGWSQWHARAVTFFESWQIWLQYFCLSGAIQPQAGCAHFLVPAIPSPPYFRNLAAFTKSKARLMYVTLKAGDRVSPSSRHFSRESRLWMVSPNLRPILGHVTLRPTEPPHLHVVLHEVRMAGSVP